MVYYKVNNLKTTLSNECRWYLNDKTGTKHQLNKYFKLKTKVKLIKADIHFLRDCKKKNVIPKFIKVRITNDNNIARKVKNDAERKWLHIALQSKYAVLNDTEWSLYKLHKQLTGHMDNAEFAKWSLFDSKVHEVSEHKLAIKKRQQRKKIRKLIKSKGNVQSKKLFKPVEIITDYVINLSSAQFDENEKLLLNRGLNFSVPDKKVPKDEIIVDTEVALKWVNNDEKEQAREQLKSILKHEFDKNNGTKKIPKFATTQTIKSLNNKDVYYLKADKGNKVVIMNKNDYIERLESAIASGPYEQIHEDPLKQMINEADETRKIIKDRWGKETGVKLKVSNPKIPLIYLQPKTHKKGERLIVSNVNSPTEEIATFLLNEFKKLIPVENRSVKNVIEFADIIDGQEIEENEIMTSFDITAMYDNIDLIETYILLDEWLMENKVPINDRIIYIKLTKACMNQCYFKFNGKFYKQKSGTSMGHILSPFLANLYIAKLEKNIEHKVQLSLKIWKRFVDDIFAIIKKTALRSWINKLNRLLPNIKFTNVVESNNRLEFLDSWVIRENGKLKVEIYRKPTHTDRYITSDSNHSRQHKSAAFNALLYRMFRLPLNDEAFNSELQNIYRIASVNGYTETFINNLMKRRQRKALLNQTTTLQRIDEDNHFSRMIFHENITPKLRHFFKHLKVKLVEVSENKLKQIFASPKDKIEKLQKSGIYKITCKCKKFYIGKSIRAILVRCKEHISCLKNNHPEKSGIAKHVLESSNYNDHGFTQENLELLKPISRETTIECYETLFILRSEKESIVNGDDGPVKSSLFELCI